jgi:antitoxin (DNA-binding transcriptional repressor) of toxin-antitoxin stability system
MRQLNLSEARRLLPSLVDEVRRSGRSILLTRHDKPVAVLSACSASVSTDIADDLPLRGLALDMGEDFDQPLADAWKVFGG